MDRWIAHVLLVTPAELRAEAAALLALISRNPADRAPEAFSVPVTHLDAPGDVTHWACHIRVRASTLGALPQLASQIAGGLWCITARDDDDEQQAAARPSVSGYLASHGLQLLHTAEDDDDVDP